MADANAIWATANQQQQQQQVDDGQYSVSGVVPPLASFMAHLNRLSDPANGLYGYPAEAILNGAVSSPYSALFRQHENTLYHNLHAAGAEVNPAANSSEIIDLTDEAEQRGNIPASSSVLTIGDRNSENLRKRAANDSNGDGIKRQHLNDGSAQPVSSQIGSLLNYASAGALNQQLAHPAFPSTTPVKMAQSLWPYMQYQQVTQPAAVSSHAPTASSTNGLKSESSETIDLTDTSAAEEQRLKEKARLEAHANALVCFGVCQTFVTDFSPKSYQAACNDNEKGLKVVLKKEHTETPDVYTLGVFSCANNQKLGVVNRTVSTALSPYLKYIRIEAVIPISKWNVYRADINMTILGRRNIANSLAQTLRRFNLTFRRPAKINVEYVDLAELFNTFAAAHAPVNGPNIKGTADDLKSQVDAVYESLVPAENLPEAVPVTKLFKHQKQALHFMLEREKYIDLDLNNSRSFKDTLWVRENGKYRNIITQEVTDKKPSIARGGILADDMGLGKTLEVISLILKSEAPDTARLDDEKSRSNNREDDTSDDDDDYQYGSGGKADTSSTGYFPPGRRGKQPRVDPVYQSLMASKATLIVCPLSTVSNWEEQFTSHVKPGIFKVYVYHGSARCLDPAKIAGHDIVITTYNVLSTEYSRDAKAASASKSLGGEASAIPNPSPLQVIHWHRVVLDEAHVIKETNTTQSRACCSLRAQKRWCLTGTPIQNRLDDIYALVRFLRAAPFDSRATWNQYISKPIRFGTGKITGEHGSTHSMSANALGISRLQTLMKHITLRRTKNSSVDGQKILTLPQRHDMVKMLDLEAEEREIYDRVDAHARKVFEGLLVKGGQEVMKNYVHVLELILKLRQLAVHPKLCKNVEGILQEFGSAVSSALTAKRAKHLYLLLREAGENKCSYCSTEIGVQKDTQAANGGQSSTASSLLDDPNNKTEEAAQNVANAEWMLSQGHQTSTSFVYPCVACQHPLDVMNDMKEVNEESDGNSKAGSKSGNGDMDFGDVVDDDGDDPCDDSGPFSRIVISTKIKALIKDLQLARQQDRDLATMSGSGEELKPSKSVVFSQWTQMLDLLEGPLKENGFRFTRLDGRMSRNSRAMALQTFKQDQSVNVLLISLKAGGVGLNLTHANRVYIMEPYWNPAVEQQAVDRIHRLGQTREVYTVRFIIRNSIENRMVQLQERKMRLARLTFREEDASTLSSSASEESVTGRKGKKAAVAGARKAAKVAAEKSREAQQAERLSDLKALLGSGGKADNSDTILLDL
ncbi:SNF2 family N-terminal domain-containing protein [Cladochytrium replicatum]|nr:SNF2 family N-terminal domain-containing protein [Cladochytrium replicatum]